jgi:hypothetical protein
MSIYEPLALLRAGYNIQPNRYAVSCHVVPYRATTNSIVSIKKTSRLKSPHWGPISPIRRRKPRTPYHPCDEDINDIVKASSYADDRKIVIGLSGNAGKLLKKL